ncbi:MAG: DNA-processing protein DprA [Bacillota bacterium]
MDEKRYWLAWNMVGGVGPKRFSMLLAHFGGAEAAWHASPDQLRIIPGFSDVIIKNRIKITEQDIDQLIKQTTEARAVVITLADQDYPPLLRHIYDAPPVLYVRGKPDFGRPSIAVVGTRTPTPLGRNIARRISAELAAHGITVVSGLARGVDTAAHQGALSCQGQTIAVLGSGIDIVYPSENYALAQKIGEHGANVTEFPPGMAPYAGNFPARNRIISGLSLGVLVVEAGLDSGSLITAEYALEQGRDVFAIPGAPGNNLSKGPNMLIKQGAKLVEEVSDILEELLLPDCYLSKTADTASASTEKNGRSLEKRISDLLTVRPVHINEIARMTGLDIARISAVLLDMEMNGLILRMQGDLIVKA